MEFDRSQWVNKDHDDLDFLTDEEKIVIINDVLDNIKAEIEQIVDEETKHDKKWARGLHYSLCVIDKHKAERR